VPGGSQESLKKVAPAVIKTLFIHLVYEGEKIMMKAAAGQGVDVGRIVEIAEAIAPEASVFDASLGVDERCLSAEKLVQLLHQGVHGEDAAHLMGCSTCTENVRNLQSVSLKSSRDFVGDALKRKVSERALPFKEDFLPAILVLTR
jgi:hypothetical protein